MTNVQRASELPGSKNQDDHAENQPSWNSRPVAQLAGSPLGPLWSGRASWGWLLCCHNNWHFWDRHLKEKRKKSVTQAAFLRTLYQQEKHLEIKLINRMKHSVSNILLVCMALVKKKSATTINNEGTFVKITNNFFHKLLVASHYFCQPHCHHFMQLYSPMALV